MTGDQPSAWKHPSLSLLLLIVLFISAVLDHIHKSLRWSHDNFQITECLINYAGGFVRRGLPGSIAWHVSHWTGIQANHLVIGVGLSCFALLLIWFLRNSTRIFPPALILSCIVMGFPAYQECIVRKDCLGLLCFLACIKLDASGMPKMMSIIAVNLIASLAILSHESFVFFALPALIFFNHSNRTPHTNRGLVFRCITLLPAAGCFVLTAIFHGTPDIARSVNDSWVPLWNEIKPGGAHQDQPSAAIHALGWTPEEGLGPGMNLLTSGFYQPMVWLALFAISFMLIVGFTARDMENGRGVERIRISTTLIIQFIFICPLFVLGHDYGRWLYLWASSSLIIHTLGLRPPKSVTSFSYFIANRLPFEKTARFLPTGDWVMLLFGVPVCWNIQSFLIASPLSRHVAIVWSWF
jgi:hypothetical protein